MGFRYTGRQDRETKKKHDDVIVNRKSGRTTFSRRVHGDLDSMIMISSLRRNL